MPRAWRRRRHAQTFLPMKHPQPIKGKTTPAGLIRSHERESRIVEAHSRRLYNADGSFFERIRDGTQILTFARKATAGVRLSIGFTPRR